MSGRNDTYWSFGIRDLECIHVCLQLLQIETFNFTFDFQSQALDLFGVDKYRNFSTVQIHPISRELQSKKRRAKVFFLDT